MEATLREEVCCGAVPVQCYQHGNWREQVTSGRKTGHWAVSGLLYLITMCMFSCMVPGYSKEAGILHIKFYQSLFHTHTHTHTPHNIQIKQQSLSTLSSTCNWSKRIRATLECFFVKSKLYNGIILVNKSVLFKRAKTKYLIF